MSHEFKPVWIRATDRSDKFCRSDNDFHLSHEAICCSNLSRRRVTAICRIVCLGRKAQPTNGVFLAIVNQVFAGSPSWQLLSTIGYQIPKQSSDNGTMFSSSQKLGGDAEHLIEGSKKMDFSIELWTLESSYNIERHGKQQLTYLKVTLCYVFTNQLLLSCQAHRCIKTAFNSSEAYSFSRKTVNTRENFWSFHCFVNRCEMKPQKVTAKLQHGLVATWHETTSWLFLPGEIFNFTVFKTDPRMNNILQKSDVESRRQDGLDVYMHAARLYISRLYRSSTL